MGFDGRGYARAYWSFLASELAALLLTAVLDRYGGGREDTPILGAITVQGLLCVAFLGGAMGSVVTAVPMGVELGLWKQGLSRWGSAVTLVAVPLLPVAAIVVLLLSL